MKRAVALLFALAAPAFAQDTSGTLVPTDGGPPMEIQSHEVQVRINNGIAVTTLTQVFRNNRNAPLEAVYSFPVPREASVSNFSMWINGKEVIGEVLEKREARRIYEQITSQRRDPGLLEQVSYRLFEVRVFPVPANGTQKIQIAYYQPVDVDSGRGLYVYPLEAKTREHSRVTGSFKLDVDLASDIPLKRVHSPSHGDAIAVRETSKGRWRASIETPRGTLDRDFVLVYDQERETTGLLLVPWRAKGEDGTLMLLLTAGEELDRNGEPANYTFLLDVSGSMGDQQKLRHAVRLVEKMLEGLGEKDRFNIVTFNIAPEILFPDGPAAAGADARARALAFLRGQTARGGTDLLPALEAASSQQRPELPNAIILLSDGNATDTEDHARFRALLDRRELRTRIFSVGIGNDVNRPLLGALAQATGGHSEFVSSQDDVERKGDLLRTKVLHHAAEDLTLKFEGVEVYDLAPAKFPNLFRGSQASIFGRYRGSGAGTITVRGRIGGKEREISVRAEFPAEERDHPEVRRMWAWRRTDDLMQEIRGRGETPARIRKVVDLGTEYSIATPYTSFLVLESDEQFRQFGIDQRNSRQVPQDRAAQDRRSSQPAARHKPSGGGGGGSVELGFLALLGALGASRALRRRRSA